MPALTKTTFQAGANEALAAVDVYAQKGGSIINGVKSLLSGNINSDAVKSLLADTLDTSKIEAVQTQFIQSKANNLVLSVDNLTQSIMKTNPALMGALNTMSSNIKESVMNPEGLVSDVKTTLSGVMSAVQGMDLSNVASIGKAVQSLVSNVNLPFSFSDVGAMAGVAGNLIKEAGSYGMTGLYTAFAEAKEFAGPGIKAITESIGPTLIELGNNDLLKEVVKMGGGAILHNKFPNFVPDYLANYKDQIKSIKSEYKSTKTGLASDFKSMSDSLSKIKPDWKAGTRAAVKVLSGIPMVKASPQAKQATKAAVDAEAPMIFEQIDAATDPANVGLIDVTTLNTSQAVPDIAYMYLATDVQTDDVNQALSQEAPMAFA